MSRKFFPEETLVDRLLLDDTEAFEELYHRYCISLYMYCIGKLNSPEDARRIVREIFVALWDNRHSLPVNFSISLHLYTEVRRAVIKCINDKLNEEEDVDSIDMNQKKNDNTWPRNNKEWWHSDVKEVAYLYVYSIINDIADKGAIK